MTEGIIDSIFDQYIHSEKCPCLFCKSFRKMRRELIKEIKKMEIHFVTRRALLVSREDLVGETKE